MLLLIAPAFAASLDNLEIGGPWGTPTATDGTAAWWNPAGLAAGSGTRLSLELAPTFATVTYQRDDPHGGDDIYRFSGPVPFAGIATDLGVHGLGLGAAFALPIARGGAEAQEPGPGAGHMREGDVKAFYVMLGAGYEIADRLSIGVTGAVVRSSWKARVTNDTLPDLADAIEDKGTPTDYTDDQLEDPDYAATLQFGELSDLTFTFGGGLRLKLDPGIAIAVSYLHGAAVDNTGDVDITFGCPPETDTTGRYAAERAGVCDTNVHADASVAYTLPSRVQAGVSWEPNRVLRLEAMGGWVHWSIYDDFSIAVSHADIESEDGKVLIEQKRKWARANHDSGWGGLDAKVHPDPKWTLGARLLYDAAAVPDEALSPNNYDANVWMLSALGAWQPLPALQIGVSYTHHFLAERTVTNSGFSQTITGTPVEDRFNYPQANGVYGGSIDRIGVQVRLAFGGQAQADGREEEEERGGRRRDVREEDREDREEGRGDGDDREDREGGGDEEGGDEEGGGDQ